ncbi:zinc finger protein with KRAB and SCAN domains 5 isoform X2 [Drosophila grimshawi]|uniref:zinc finger protein with KRAB and SCAN domains 5 isoform X2 n=1 Tax=Drosophila grimshawi TaxID=7222 RepID=UPI000C8712FA|nr:zinc finger protein with KRAB and SCAN domains 5 isoform X2 [Drosophila grimshawi]
MFNSERKRSAWRPLADATGRQRTDSSGKMSLCRACLVLLSTEDAGYNLYREKDLAAKFIGCMGASEGLRFLGAPFDEEKFYDFQRMCEESLRNFQILMAQVNAKAKDQIAEYPEKKQEENQITQISAFALDSMEDIEEVYIIEDDAAKQTLGKERPTKVATSFNIPKRPCGLRHKIECNICGRGFYKMSVYEAHMQIHQGKQPYKCTVDKCEKSYSRANLLEVHLREVHQNNRSTFTCTEPNCNKVYSALSSLNYHLRRQHIQHPKDVESSSSEHVCEKCGKCYGRRAHLTRHQWVHRSKNECTFACNVCGMRFYTKQNLNDHFLRRHSNSNQLWRCKRCVRIFGSRLALSVHMKKHLRSTRNP